MSSTSIQDQTKRAASRMGTAYGNDKLGAGKVAVNVVNGGWSAGVRPRPSGHEGCADAGGTRQGAKEWPGGTGQS
jgi:hypothetical protein